MTFLQCIVELAILLLCRSLFIKQLFLVLFDVVFRDHKWYYN